MRRIYIISLFFILVLCGCKGHNKKENSSFNPREARQKLEQINKVLAEKDKEQIEAYIERMQLDGMDENQAGLFYLVWGKHTGVKVETDDIVTIHYTISLLDGTECYTTRNKAVKEFMVGKGGVESGLEMAILLMHEGQKGKFIVPPHLGHGLLGDSKQIPPLSILVFDVDLLEVIKK